MHMHYDKSHMHGTNIFGTFRTQNNDFYHMSGIGLAILELIEDSKEFILNHRDCQPYESLKIYTRWEEQRTA